MGGGGAGQPGRPAQRIRRPEGLRDGRIHAPILHRAAMAGSWRRERGARSWRTSTRRASSPAARDSVLLRRASSRRRVHPFSSPFLFSAREVVGDRGRWWARAGSRSPSTAPNLKEAGADGIFASSIPWRAAPFRLAGVAPLARRCATPPPRARGTGRRREQP
jgi:hypothetical protein